jgi:hypothetical protein
VVSRPGTRIANMALRTTGPLAGSSPGNNACGVALCGRLYGTHFHQPLWLAPLSRPLSLGAG